ncbi:zinc-dependent alcohol dehydrogenase family protein [Afifella marina]|uniref:NADPH:quinone reductase n=1 Tax=Afifella marina DSM 2698 TaxID=1120955 RepID=A0A1G5MKK6_AFIMA|nr:NAD(P)-dependent alcohol dehydrogenase [Afifella marina]MBK1623865.1 NAD(P)-dependent alcohol dehydrogenase [Afifella marina DSM 2698]MBK1627219.1 NAD(P)-dependent alcohol dehydrogenase [Afifella marina]MBK5918752.1 alcohol dehydrogenase [Afifella marina]RAI22639.1 alcohol dehydrogenase [Afifella marina DSM 2698]SCZ25735.1 NADPH:quinone reductase [Afifella marina DSM 2698]
MTEMQRWEIDAVGLDRLQLHERPMPTPGIGEILVRTEAVALNYRDKMVVETGRGLPLRFPFTPGSDLAGEVAALGEGACRFAVGDRVVSTPTPDWIDGLRPGTARTPAYQTLGGYYPGVLAEYVAMPEVWFAKAPKSLEPWQAATLPVAGLTAWSALAESVRVRAGDTVLIPSTGGVALFGLQIAKASGAEVIVCGQPNNEARVRALGADHFVNAGAEDWMDEVYRITSDRGADIVLEVIGGAHLGQSVELAAVGGHVCQIGALDGFEFSSAAMPLMLKNVTIHGIGTGSRSALERLVRAVDRAGIRPVVDARYPLAELPAAFAHLARGPFGKVVIDMR